MKDYHEMTKDELIAYLQDIEDKRAFSVEDQIVLRIIDELPFSLWASDENCIITFWTDKAASLYGYTKKQALGKDFVKLFVDPDEQPQARIDQKKITDEGEQFHNIAHDRGKNGNILNLMTFCSRIYDPKTNKPWNAEMGIIMDFYEDEIKKWKIFTGEARETRNLIEQYSEMADGFYTQIENRHVLLEDSIQNCLIQAAKVGKRNEVQDEVNRIKAELKEGKSTAKEILVHFREAIKESTSKEQCRTLLDKLKEDNETVSSITNDLIVDVVELSSNCESNQNLLVEKDNLLTKINDTLNRINERIVLITKGINDKMEAYKTSITGEPDTEKGPYAEHIKQMNSLTLLKDSIRTEELGMRQKVRNAKSEADIDIIHKELASKSDQWDKQLEKIK